MEECTTECMRPHRITSPVNTTEEILYTPMARSTSDYCGSNRRRDMERTSSTISDRNGTHRRWAASGTRTSSATSSSGCLWAWRSLANTRVRTDTHPAKRPRERRRHGNPCPRSSDARRLRKASRESGLTSGAKRRQRWIAACEHLGCDSRLRSE